MPLLPAFKFFTARPQVFINLGSYFRLSQHSHGCHPGAFWRTAGRDGSSASKVATGDIGLNKLAPAFFVLRSPSRVARSTGRKGPSASFAVLRIAHQSGTLGLRCVRGMLTIANQGHSTLPKPFRCNFHLTQNAEASAMRCNSAGAVHYRCNCALIQSKNLGSIGCRSAVVSNR